MNELPDEVLNGFLAWHDDAKRRGLFDRGVEVSVYTMLKEAFYGGVRFRPLPVRQPSRDALGDRDPQQRQMARKYAPPQPWSPPSELKATVRPHFERREGDVVRFWPEIVPDLTPQGPPKRQPTFTPAGGFTAGPSVETLERVQRGLQARMAAGEPLPRPEPPPLKGMPRSGGPSVGPEDTMVFAAVAQDDQIEDEDDNFGPPGPVMTPLEALPELEDGARDL